MHIVVIPSWYPSSETDVDGIFFRLQAQALQREGMKIGMVVPMFRYLRSQPKTIFSRFYGLRRHQQGGLNTYAYDSMYFFPRCPVVDIDRIRWVNAGMKAFEAYIADNGKPDVIHAHCVNYAAILACAIFKKYGIPYVITEHSSAISRGLVRKNQWPSMHEAVRHSAARFAVSRDFCRILEKTYAGTDWQYLPNMLGGNFEQDFEFPEKNNQDFTFCSVSHLRHLKGHDLLLPAFAEALKTYPQLKLKIGGGGVEEGRLKQLASDLGINHAVTFTGALTTDQTLDLMRHSNAFVLASRTETFGVVYIEALSQGLPVIATRCGGPESIVTSDNGLLVPIENIPELTKALLTLYETHAQYDPVRLRQDCLQQFGSRAIAQHLIDTFQKVLNK